MAGETRFGEPWAKRVPGERTYPVGGFAPGNYWGRCQTCGLNFDGDKRAVQCEPCGIARQAAWDAHHVAMEAEYGPHAMTIRAALARKEG